MIRSLFRVRMWRPGLPRHIRHVVQWWFAGSTFGSSTLQDLDGGRRHNLRVVVKFVERRSKG